MHGKTLVEHLAQSGHNITGIAWSPRHAPYLEIIKGVNVHIIDSFFQRLPFLFKDPQIKYQPPAPDWLLMAGLKNIIQAGKGMLKQALYRDLLM